MSGKHPDIAEVKITSTFFMNNSGFGAKFIEQKRSQGRPYQNKHPGPTLEKIVGMKKFFPGMAHDIMAEHKLKDNGHPQPNQSYGHSLTGGSYFPDAGQPPYIQAHQDNSGQGGYLMSRQFANDFAVSRLSQYSVQDSDNHEGQPSDHVFPDHSFVPLTFL